MKIIKYIFTLILCTTCCYTLAACGNDDPAEEEAAKVTVNSESLQFSTSASSQTVSVTSNKPWSAYSDDSWITVTQSSANAGNGTIVVAVTENTSTDIREGEVVIKAGTSRTSIKVSQEAVEKPVEGDIKCPIDGYSLVWNDEFNGDELNGKKWTYEVKGSGWVNNEEQNYVAGSTPLGKPVTTVSNGTLKINAIEENSKIYSARIYGNVKTGWTYCYIEASIKLPQGKGTWPAFWMMPVNYTSWPADGEIDIMEEVGCNPNYCSCTIHCNKYNNGNTSIEHSEKKIATAESDFHKYGMEWTKDYMTFYQDGKAILTYKNDGSGKNSWPFYAAFYPILNLAWGGSWGGMYGTDRTALPATMEVDYVRVFQK